MMKPLYTGCILIENMELFIFHSFVSDMGRRTETLWLQQAIRCDPTMKRARENDAGDASTLRDVKNDVRLKAESSSAKTSTGGTPHTDEPAARCVQLWWTVISDSLLPSWSARRESVRCTEVRTTTKPLTI